MDMHSSPRLPARNQPTNRPSYAVPDGLNSTKKQHRRLDLDDSSSVTSSSTTRQYLCSVCKDPERLPIDPLIACKACKRRFHPKCTNPFPTDAAEFWCNNLKCQAKKNAPGPTSGTIIPSRSEPSVRLEPSTIVDGPDVRLYCAKEGCSTPLFSNISSLLCKLHAIEAKHEASRNAPKAAPTQSKPINKSKLYPTKPSDRPLMTRDRTSERAHVKRSGSSKSALPPIKPSAMRSSHATVPFGPPYKQSLPAFERRPHSSSSAASSTAVRSPVVASVNSVDDRSKSQANPQYHTDSPASKHADLVSRSPVETSNTLQVSETGMGNAQQSVLTCWYWAHSSVPCKWSDEKCKYLHGISSFGVAEPPPGRRPSIQQWSRSAQDDVAGFSNLVVSSMSSGNRQMPLERPSNKDESVPSVTAGLLASANDDSSEYEPPSPHQPESSSPEYEPPPPLNQPGLGTASNTTLPAKKHDVQFPLSSSVPIVITHQKQASATTSLDSEASFSLGKTHHHHGDVIGDELVHGLANVNVPSPFEKTTSTTSSGKPLGYKSPFYYSDDDEDDNIAPSKITSIELSETTQVTGRHSSHQESTTLPIEEHEEDWGGGDDLSDMEMDLDTPEPDLAPIYKQPLHMPAQAVEDAIIFQRRLDPDQNVLSATSTVPPAAVTTLDHARAVNDKKASIMEQGENSVATNHEGQIYEINGLGKESENRTNLGKEGANEPSRLSEVQNDRIHATGIMHQGPINKSTVHSQPQMEAENEPPIPQGERLASTALEAQVKPRMDLEPEQLANTTEPAWADLIGTQLPQQPQNAEEIKVAYNSTALDAYLSKPLRDPEYEPSDREILDTQIWASINPIKTWPKRYSEEWRAAKMKEIAARPKRKSRHRYRRTGDEGPARSEEEIEQVIDFCETLFGVGLSGIRGGTLGMRDERWICVKEVPEPEYEEEIQETDSEEVIGDWEDDDFPSQATKRTHSQSDEDGDMEMEMEIEDMKVEVVQERTTPRRKRKR